MHAGMDYSRPERQGAATSGPLDTHLVWHVEVGQDDVKGISAATLLYFVHGLLPIHRRHDVGVTQAPQDT